MHEGIEDRDHVTVASEAGLIANPFVSDWVSIGCGLLVYPIPVSMKH